MSYEVLLAVADDLLGARLVALLDETGEFRVSGQARSVGELRPLLERRPADVLLLHEDLGPLPTVELLRELAGRHPRLGIVLGVREPSLHLVRSAMEAGARGLVTLPPSLEELQVRLSAAAGWSVSVRQREDETKVGVSSKMIAVAGAKGGAGATTVASQLALAAAVHGTRRVCLVDLDLQTGDVPTQLGLLHGRTVLDLVEVAEDVTARAVEDTVFVHRSGLRVLLGPVEGERAEEVDAMVARNVLGAILSRFDIVVVDCGSQTTEATAMAIGMADTILLTVTPDVQTLRAARRLLQLWGRLEVCKPDDVVMVVNRRSRHNEIQPRVAGQIAGLTVADSSLPARDDELEPVLNAGPGEDPSDHPLWAAVTALGREVGVVPPARSRWRGLRRSGTGRPDGPGPTGRGTAAPTGAAGEPAESQGGGDPRRRGRGRPWRRVGQDAGLGQLLEGSAAIGLVLVGMLVVVQGLLGLFTQVLASRAATIGAHELAVGQPVESTVLANLPPGWRREARVEVAGDRVRVTLTTPAFLGDLVPGWGDFHLSGQAGTVREP